METQTYETLGAYRYIDLRDMASTIMDGDDPRNGAAKIIYGAMVKAGLVDDLDGFADLCDEVGEAIRGDDFRHYAEELAYDMGNVGGDNNVWPLYCIDWDYAAAVLQQDYSDFSLGDDVYYVLTR